MSLRVQEEYTEVGRYLTVGGAVVAVYRSRHGVAFSWECLGCNEHHSVPRDDWERYGWEARKQAQEHAEVCRAVPANAQMAGPPSLGSRHVVAELARLRTDIGDVASAVRGLAEVVAGLGERMTAAERTVGEAVEAVAVELGELHEEIAQAVAQTPEPEEPAFQVLRWAWPRGGEGR
ncbi:hypothetical protein ACFY4C_41140 [Actinomadura viridis]|uniref:hypothetical protein n=1 Tax=Actinomadura viridis TaxID=58110 RepID=UPI0036CE6A71